MEGLSICRAWVEERGPLGSMPVGSEYKGFAIGQWLNQRRIRRRRGTLPVEQVTALSELGINWYPLDSGWEEGIHVARAWAAEHGSLASVTAGTVYEGFPLGKWVKERRVYRRRGTLSTERVAALDELGMEWDPRWHEERWQRGIQVARAWAAEHSSLASVPVTTTHEGYPLGQWLNNLRAKQRNGRLARERVAALERLGMVWEPTLVGWEKGIQVASQWTDEHGSLGLVTRGTVYRGFPLGAWLNKRRHEMRKGRLAQDRIDALDRLGIDWHPPMGPRDRR